MVAHIGEVNSKIENQQGNQLFLISAKTSPGNSGGPIINTLGTVVGIIARNLYANYGVDQEDKDERRAWSVPYHAGIPASVVMDFIDNVNSG